MSGIIEPSRVLLANGQTVEVDSTMAGLVVRVRQGDGVLAWSALVSELDAWSIEKAIAFQRRCFLGGSR